MCCRATSVTSVIGLNMNRQLVFHLILRLKIPPPRVPPSEHVSSCKRRTWLCPFSFTTFAYNLWVSLAYMTKLLALLQRGCLSQCIIVYYATSLTTDIKRILNWILDPKKIFTKRFPFSDCQHCKIVNPWYWHWYIDHDYGGWQSKWVSPTSKPSSISISASLAAYAVVKCRGKIQNWRMISLCSLYEIRDLGRKSRTDLRS